MQFNSTLHFAYVVSVNGRLKWAGHVECEIDADLVELCMTMDVIRQSTHTQYIQ